MLPPPLLTELECNGTFGRMTAGLLEVTTSSFDGARM